MMLGRQDLLTLWKRKKIRFQPDISPDQISLSSIDLRLGFRFTTQKVQKALVIRPAYDLDPTDITEMRDFTGDSEAIFRLEPKQFKLAQTLERITVPANLAAQVNGKSSLSRAGLSVHATAPHINPGFDAPITLELFNHGEWELEFVPGIDLICQVAFWQIKTPVGKEAISKLSSYQGQTVPYPAKKKRQ
jgi:dCTP deaminase